MKNKNKKKKERDLKIHQNSDDDITSIIEKILIR